jgi:hypothetical protein
MVDDTHLTQLIVLIMRYGQTVRPNSQPRFVEHGPPNKLTHHVKRNTHALYHDKQTVGIDRWLFCRSTVGDEHLREDHEAMELES